MWAELASVAGPVLGGLLGSRSAKKAAKQQQEAAQQGLAAQKEMYEQSRADLAPYRGTGAAANSRLSYLLGLEGGGNPAVAQAQSAYDQAQQRYNALASSSRVPEGWRFDNSGTGATQGGSSGGYRRLDASGNTEWMDPQLAGMYSGGGSSGGGASTAELDAARSALDAAKAQPWTPGSDYGSLMEKFTGQKLYDDPGYQFRLDEGLKGMQNTGAARGMQLSGAQMKGLNRYGQDYASNEFNAARNRWVGDQDQTVNYLTGATNRGMNAATNSANFAQNYGNNASNAYNNMGDIRSAGTIASGNALQSGLNQGINAYGDIQARDRLNERLRGGSANKSTVTPWISGTRQTEYW